MPGSVLNTLASPITPSGHKEHHDRVEFSYSSSEIPGEGFAPLSSNLDNRIVKSTENAGTREN